MREWAEVCLAYAKLRHPAPALLDATVRLSTAFPEELSAASLGVLGAAFRWAHVRSEGFAAVAERHYEELTDAESASASEWMFQVMNLIDINSLPPGLLRLAAMSCIESAHVSGSCPLSPPPLPTGTEHGMQAIPAGGWAD